MDELLFPDGVRPVIGIVFPIVRLPFGQPFVVFWPLGWHLKVC